MEMRDQFGKAFLLNSNANLICADVGNNKCRRTIDPAEAFDGKWHFIAGVWSGGNKVRLYFDGVCFEVTGSYSTANNTDNFGLSVGNYNSLTNRFKGDIADVRVYKSALTTKQIQQLYRYGQSILK